MDVETNPGPRRLVPAVCRILCSNMQGLAGNLSDLTVASALYDMLVCSETLVSDMRHVSELLVPGFGRPVLLFRCKLPRARGMAAYVRDGYRAGFDCLLASMAALQAEDVHASFLFVGDLNGHHQEWLSSTTTNRHGVAAFDFATVSGCDQLTVGPTHASGGTLDLLTTDIPDLVLVAVVAPTDNSDHSSLSAVISMAQAVPNLCVC